MVFNAVAGDGFCVRASVALVGRICEVDRRGGYGRIRAARLRGWLHPTPARGNACMAPGERRRGDALCIALITLCGP